MRVPILAVVLALALPSLAAGAVCRNPLNGLAVACPPRAGASAVNRAVVLSSRVRGPRCRDLATGRLGACGPAPAPPRTAPGRQGEPLGVAPLQ